MPSYDPNNIFAKILRGELPSYKVYEDDKAIAFLILCPVHRDTPSFYRKRQPGIFSISAPTIWRT